MDSQGKRRKVNESSRVEQPENREGIERGGQAVSHSSAAGTRGNQSRRGSDMSAARSRGEASGQSSGSNGSDNAEISGTTMVTRAAIDGVAEFPNVVFAT